MDIRSATSGDIDALVNLMEAFYAESDMTLDRPWAAMSFAALLSQPHLGSVWLAEVSGVPVGYAVLTVRHSMEFGGLAGTVDDLFVGPDHRRCGVGNELLARVMDACAARGCQAVQVEVGRDNGPALALYRRLGLDSVDDERTILCRELRG
jgi:ribosomal protein S18 acetylase RimI-like enzyme